MHALSKFKENKQVPESSKRQIKTLFVFTNVFKAKWNGIAAHALEKKIMKKRKKKSSR
jgi:hypothetical protein